MKRKAYIVHNLDSLATLMLFKWVGIEFDSIDCISYKDPIKKLEQKFIFGGDKTKYDEFYFINFYNDILDDFKHELSGHKCKFLVSDNPDVLTHTLVQSLLSDKLNLDHDKHLFLELINDIELNYFENSKSLLVFDLFNILGFAYDKFLDFYSNGFKPHTSFKDSVDVFKNTFDKNKVYDLKFLKFNVKSVIGKYSDIYFYCYKFLHDNKYDGLMLVDVEHKKVYFKVKNESSLDGLKLIQNLCNGVGTRMNSSGEITQPFLNFIQKYQIV